MLTAVSQPHFDAPLRIVLMGVAGCGKSTVGVALAPLLGAEYLDGDDLHPIENITKMRNGTPLTDADRWPWLTQVGDALKGNRRRIVGCSALKRIYRDLIVQSAGQAVTFVHLSGSRSVIEARMSARQGHFMPPALIESQFAALEAPAPDEHAITVDIDQPLASVLRSILAGIADLHA